MNILCYGDSNTFGWDPRSFFGGRYNEPWPEFDESQTKADEVEIAVQIKVKVRARVMVPADATKEQLEEAGKAAVADQLAGKDIKKVIVVPGRLVNIVAL